MKELSTLTLPELKTLSRRIVGEIHKRQSIGRQEFVKRLSRLAQDHGFTLAEVLGTQAPQKSAPKRVNGSTQGKKPLKYWNPLDPTIGWSGHARRPGWVVTWLENGGKLEELTRKRT